MVLLFFLSVLLAIFDVLFQHLRGFLGIFGAQSKKKKILKKIFFECEIAQIRNLFGLSKKCGTCQNQKSKNL